METRVSTFTPFGSLVESYKRKQIAFHLHFFANPSGNRTNRDFCATIAGSNSLLNAVPAPSDLDSIVARPLAEFIRSLDEDALVLDIGCGPGRGLGLRAQRGTRCIGLDRSRVSVQMASNRYGRPRIVADNLKLPLADGMADAVISDGVIHHTNDPSASFTENCRVLK